MKGRLLIFALLCFFFFNGFVEGQETQGKVDESKEFNICWEKEKNQCFEECKTKKETPGFMENLYSVLGPKVIRKKQYSYCESICLQQTHVLCTEKLLEM
jgi:hypothetical protein